MNAKLSIVVATCVALFASACGSSPKSVILGKWEVARAKVGGADVGSAAEIGRAIQMTAEFNRDGTAKITMFGRTLPGYVQIGTPETNWNGQ